MSMLSVINDAMGTLETVGSGYAVHLRDLLLVDAEGNLAVPDDPDQFIVTLITTTPLHEWGTVKDNTVRLQVNAWSTTEGNPLAMLALAQAALVADRYIPLPVVNLGRDGAYTGYAQDYERGTA